MKRSFPYLVSGSEELANRQPDRRVDTRGLVCPYPSLETAKLAASSSGKEVIGILSDDEYTALNSIPTILKGKGFDCSVEKIDGRCWLVKAARSP